MYEVLRCQDENRNINKIENCVGDDCEVDPKCATDDKIEEWMKYKKA